MEKLAQYLFVSGMLTTLLAIAAFAIQELASRMQSRQPVLVAVGRSRASASLPAEPAFEGIGRYGTMLNWFSVVILTLSVVVRASVAGRGPFSNMYDYSIAFALGIVVVYGVIDWRYHMRGLALVVLPVAAALMIYAVTQPSRIAPLVPALQNNTMLTLHVSVAIIAYSCFATSFGAATLYLAQSRFHTSWLPRTEATDEVGFLSAALGFPFMTLVLVLGAYWANVAWGRYWGWDPKETASLVTWLLYAGYLHTRALAQWRGTRSAWLLVLGFVAVMLTYFGNYFLSGLHSYK